MRFYRNGRGFESYRGRMTSETVKKTKVELPMPCLCSDEGKAEAYDLRDEVMEALGLDNMEEFVSHVIASLEHEYRCTVNGMYVDMWFGVSAENETEKFFLPCDRVEDGLALIWKYHKDNRPNSGEYGDGEGSPSGTV